MFRSAIKKAKCIVVVGIDCHREASRATQTELRADNEYERSGSTAQIMWISVWISERL